MEIKIELKNHIHKEINGNTYDRMEYAVIGESELLPLYRVTDDISCYGENDNEKVRCIRVEKMPNSYLPEIYYMTDFYGVENKRFEIQTTSYGTLALDDFKNFYAAQRAAIYVAEALTEKFINGGEQA